MEELMKYPFEVSPLSEKEGGGYLISFPDLPGCVSDGETIEEGIRNGMDAVRAWIETAKEFADPIPKPGGSHINSLVTAIIAESLGKREAHR